MLCRSTYLSVPVPTFARAFELGQNPSAKGLPGSHVVRVGRQGIETGRHSRGLRACCVLVKTAATRLAQALGCVSLRKAVNSLRRCCRSTEGLAVCDAIAVEAHGAMAGEASGHVDAGSIRRAVVSAPRTFVDVVTDTVGSGLSVALVADAVEGAGGVHARALSAASVLALPLPPPILHRVVRFALIHVFACEAIALPPLIALAYVTAIIRRL